EFEKVYSDILFLSQLKNFRNILNVHISQGHLTPHLISLLADDFESFSNNKRTYDEIVWIDNNGLEKIRINYNNGNVKNVPYDKLQNRIDSEYFKQVITLDDGQIYVSPIDLGHENSKSTLNDKQIIRIAMPVYDSNDQNKGILLLNFKTRHLIDNIKVTLSENIQHFYLVNEQGFWLFNPYLYFDFDQNYPIHNSSNLKLKYPHSWEQISKNKFGQFINDKGLWSFIRVQPIQMLNANSTNKNTNHSYLGNLNNLTMKVSTTSHSHQHHSMNMAMKSDSSIDKFAHSWHLISHIHVDDIEQIVFKTLKKVIFSVFILILIGLVGGVLLTINIIRREDADTESEKLNMRSLLLQSLAEGVFGIDHHGHCTFINNQASSMLGFKQDELIGNKIHDYIHHHLPNGNSYSENDCPIYKVLTNKKKHAGEELFFKKDGSSFPVNLNALPIIENDILTGAVVSFFDISQLKENEALIKRQERYDSLTSLPNRKFFLEILNEQIALANRTNEPLWVLFLNLDDFKYINDILGHSEADKLLIMVTQRILNSIRETDIVARIGGDEFVVILHSVNEVADIDKVASKLLYAISQPYEFDIENLHVTVSIGISNYPNDADNADNLLKFADQSMSAAKSEGRNRYTYFTPSLQYGAMIRNQMITDLNQAIKDDHFQLFYQPIIDLHNDKVYKAESLIRWFHPDKGIISPGSFIPIAEETGIISEIGQWIFKDAFKQIETWSKDLPDSFQLSINLSPIQLKNLDPKYHSWINDLSNIKDTGASIIVEITENMLIKDQELVNQKLIDYRNAGVEVAIDDFGTGYSSLSYLKEFDIDYLKVDQSFVRNLKPGSKEESLIEAIIVMAHKLNFKVIAEGIETQQQLSMLKAMDCDFGQGYIFSRPIPANEFKEKFLN
ncbi:MAG: EAL domain-containing protein, partial [Gammaproteobacteria bacterium]|nr:EAL domain-containing protein [Gammaproteobacteria bacterium]